MINKKENDKRAEELKKIADKYSLVDINDSINSFLEENLKYQAHILMVGGFSAGKSALLNKYIGALCQMLGYSPYESSLAPIIVMVGAILFAQK